MLKRTIDIVMSSLLLFALAPVLVGIAVAIALDTGFPILFRQERIGKGFRPFSLLKFRSMNPDAGPEITVRGDTRITRAGRILRATKLDELPQLWNVIRGDMSLVGPRPEVPAYVALYRSRYENILNVRPGITDIASVRFRHEEEFLAAQSKPLQVYAEQVLPEKLNLADEYIRRQSLALDAWILIKTIRTVIWPRYAVLDGLEERHENLS